MNAKMTEPDVYTQCVGARWKAYAALIRTGNCGRSAGSGMQPLHPADVERRSR